MIEYLYLGRVGYREGLRLQAEIAPLVAESRLSNVLLLLEHPPVLTLGRNANRANVLAADSMLAARGIEIHHINRGGDVTYHGPGQLVGYPIFDLRALRNASGGRMGPVDFVRGMEEALIRVCMEFGVRAGRVAGLTGVWCGSPPRPGKAGPGKAAPGTEGPGTEGPGTDAQWTRCDRAGGERKIAAIGIHVARGVTSHGFALNVTTNLRDFELIVPCGIPDHAVTSLEREIAPGAALPELEAIAHQIARQFSVVFGQQVVAAADLDTLRSHARTGRLFPAQDTPVEVPDEVRRLLGNEERPMRA